MKKSMLLLLAMIVFSNAYTQKLPSKQQISVRAPAGARADGKAAEWGKLQAHNPATEFYYTIANDDKKLYLVIQSDESPIMRKLILGGLTFIIQKTMEKNHKNAVAVEFPYYKEKQRNFNFAFSAKLNSGRDNLPADPLLLKSANQNLRALAKWIYFKNLSGKETILPIYNEEGIEAMNAFDTTKTYTYELAIDLNAIGLSATNGDKFSYHIMVNGGTNRFVNQGFRSATPMSQEVSDAMQLSNSVFSADTDFWGEYILIK